MSRPNAKAVYVNESSRDTSGPWKDAEGIQCETKAQLDGVK